MVYEGPPAKQSRRPGSPKGTERGTETTTERAHTRTHDLSIILLVYT